MAHSNIGSAAPDWASAAGFCRYDSVLRALRRLHQLNPGPSQIVETGTLRGESEVARRGDGWSTLAWGWYGKQTGGRVVTVDIEAGALAVCKRLTAEYAGIIEYAESDSITFLKAWDLSKRGHINLLYLDSVDYVDTERSEAHHLEEARAALPLLAPRCLVLIDDTIPVIASAGVPAELRRVAASISPAGAFTGKGATAVPFLVEQGFAIEWAADGQLLLSRGADDVPEPAIDGELTRKFRASLLAEALAEEQLLAPLVAVGAECDRWASGNAHHEYFDAILSHCGADGSTCEIGAVSGYAPVLLSKQGRKAAGIAFNACTRERLRQVNNRLAGSAEFGRGDPFIFERLGGGQRYSVIHHWDLLATLPAPWARSILARQVMAAEFVVASVPSAHSTEDTGPAGSGRFLLPIDGWRTLLDGFDIVELRYIDQATPNANDRILFVLRGQQATPELQAMMTVPFDAYPFGISVITLAKNEERHVGPCIDSLEGCGDEVFVVDMESSDGTRRIAEERGAVVIPHPQILGWDRARMAAAALARYKYTLVIDADERLPRGFGAALRRLLAERGHRFEALQLPFATYFANRRMVSISPYKAPSVFRTGLYFYNSRPHQGARVDGSVAAMPADNPDAFLNHYSYDSISHYISKMDGYSSTAAANMREDSSMFNWREMVAHAVHDMSRYYDTGGGPRDGVHGLLYAVLSGFNRIAQHGKLYETRVNEGAALQPQETQVPASIEDFLVFALSVVRAARGRREPDAGGWGLRAGTHAEGETARGGEGENLPNASTPNTEPQALMPNTGPQALTPNASTPNTEPQALMPNTGPQALTPNAPTPNTEPQALMPNTGPQALTPNAPTPDSAPKAQTPYSLPPTAYDLAYEAPFSSASGYGEESRHSLFALDEAGVDVIAHKRQWHAAGLSLCSAESERLSALACRVRKGGRLVQLVQDFGSNYRRLPEAAVSILRTVFETDRTPADWIGPMCQADRIWVPSEFNVRTLSSSGVPVSKFAVIPECFDPAPYLEPGEPTPLAREIRGSGRFTFLFLGEWRLGKGWQPIIRAFVEAFEGRTDVALVLKTWSSLGVDGASIQRIARRFAQCELDHDLPGDNRIRFVTDEGGMSRADLISLYRACDAFALPSSGEGWGRGMMEAMACGLPTIAVGWSGNTAFMTAENSYLVNSTVVPVPAEAYAETPVYKGHRWAQVDIEDLKAKLLRVYTERGEAQAIGKRAQDEVCEKYSRTAVGKLMREELDRVMG